MNTKRYTILTIAYSLIILAVIASLSVIIDPCLHYHAPIGSFEAVETDERLAMPGVAKHLTYDTALIGSSMSENFKASWFEDGVFGDSCVKICLQGAHFPDYDLILKEVCAHPDVRNIVFCLDDYLLTDDPASYTCSIPEFISNDKLSDDCYYILNNSTTFEYLPLYLIRNITSSEDEAYVWTDNYDFSPEAVKAVYVPQRLTETESEKPIDYFFANVDSFIASIGPYIESRPDVTFYFYASPYSILFWDDCQHRGNLSALINALGYSYEKLLAYDNVRLFFFQDDYDLITDLNHYRDYSHFDQGVNRYMYECMRDGKKEMYPDTISDRLKTLYDYTKDFDYDAILN
jgi:hypothetical protein